MINLIKVSMIKIITIQITINIAKEDMKKINIIITIIRMNINMKKLLKNYKCY